MPKAKVMMPEGMREGKRENEPEGMLEQDAGLLESSTFSYHSLASLGSKVSLRIQQGLVEIAPNGFYLGFESGHRTVLGADQHI